MTAEVAVFFTTDGGLADSAREPYLERATVWMRPSFGTQSVLIAECPDAETAEMVRAAVESFCTPGGT